MSNTIEKRNNIISISTCIKFSTVGKMLRINFEISEKLMDIFNHSFAPVVYGASKCNTEF